MISSSSSSISMERQKSFSSFKPTRLLVFSFTIFSSFFFLSTFTIWLTKSTTPSLLHQPTHLLHFNNTSPSPSSSLNVGLRSFAVQTLASSAENFTVTGVKVPTLLHNRLGGTHNSFNFVPGSKSEQVAVVNHANASSTVVNSAEMQEQRNVSAGFVAGRVEKVSILKEIVEDKAAKGCDLTKGYWVFDESYPLYAKDSCPFIDEGFDCEGNGRLDRNYSKWRWQPQDCDFPKFNATRMLELIRGKRLVFVGDSINRNQWESMLCMLFSAIRDPKRVYETHGRKITKEKGNYSFRFLDYECTVEYYVSHFLVHESKARIGQKRRPTLRIDAIDHSSSRWRGADILVFNSAHWWSHSKTKAGINYYQEGNLVHPKLDVSAAFRKALTTWATWVDRHINPRKTLVFFRSSAPSHFRGGNWNSGGHCMDATEPLNETLGATYVDEKNVIIEEMMKQMKTPLTFLNITSLSEYRVDGHPSIYGRKTQSRGIQDCSHWCLPGVPDTWNRLLYFHLQTR